MANPQKMRGMKGNIARGAGYLAEALASLLLMLLLAAGGWHFGLRKRG